MADDDSIITSKNLIHRSKYVYYIPLCLKMVPQQQKQASTKKKRKKARKKKKLETAACLHSISYTTLFF